MLMEQPDGLPLHHICRLVGHAAWLRYITLKKRETGCMEKVSREILVYINDFIVLYFSQAKINYECIG